MSFWRLLVENGRRTGPVEITTRPILPLRSAPFSRPSSAYRLCNAFWSPVGLLSDVFFVFWASFLITFGIIFRYLFAIDFCMSFWMSFWRLLVQNGASIGTIEITTRPILLLRSAPFSCPSSAYRLCNAFWSPVGLLLDAFWFTLAPFWFPVAYFSCILVHFRVAESCLFFVSHLLGISVCTP